MPDFEKYDKERVKTFLKYLVHAASKYSTEQVIEEKLSGRLREKERKDVMQIQGSHERIKDISDKRKNELDMKIKMHYTKNRFLPYELRLKKLRREYYNLRRRKNTKKREIEAVKKKIDECQAILKELKAEADNY